MVKCCAVMCKSSKYRNTPGVTYHSFPKDEKMRDKWLANMKRPDWKPRTGSVLCSKHFDSYLVDASEFRTRLLHGAVPTIFDLPPKLPKKTTKTRLAKKRKRTTQRSYRPKKKRKKAVDGSNTEAERPASMPSQSECQPDELKQTNSTPRPYELECQVEEVECKDDVKLCVAEDGLNTEALTTSEFECQSEMLTQSNSTPRPYGFENVEIVAVNAVKTEEEPTDSMPSKFEYETDTQKQMESTTYELNYVKNVMVDGLNTESESSASMPSQSESQPEMQKRTSSTSRPHKLKCQKNMGLDGLNTEASMPSKSECQSDMLTQTNSTPRPHGLAPQPYGLENVKIVAVNTIKTEEEPTDSMPSKFEYETDTQKQMESTTYELNYVKNIMVVDGLNTESESSASMPSQSECQPEMEKRTVSTSRPHKLKCQKNMAVDGLNTEASMPSKSECQSDKLTQTDSTPRPHGLAPQPYGLENVKIVAVNTIKTEEETPASMPFKSECETKTQKQMETAPYGLKYVKNIMVVGGINKEVEKTADRPTQLDTKEHVSKRNTVKKDSYIKKILPSCTTSETGLPPYGLSPRPYGLKYAKNIMVVGGTNTEAERTADRSTQLDTKEHVSKRNTVKKDSYINKILPSCTKCETGLPPYGTKYAKNIMVAEGINTKAERTADRPTQLDTKEHVSKRNTVKKDSYINKILPSCTTSETGLPPHGLSPRPYGLKYAKNIMVVEGINTIKNIMVAEGINTKAKRTADRPTKLDIKEHVSKSKTVKKDSYFNKILLSCTTSKTGLTQPPLTGEKENEEAYRMLQTTIKKIIKKSKFYVGLPTSCCHLLNLIGDKTKLPEHHILVCLKKIRLDTEFEELADDFMITPSYASEMFMTSIPLISSVMRPFIIKQNFLITRTILPQAFRRKYFNVTSIIDCLEINVQKASNTENRGDTKSQTDTVKYLISCTPDGLINYVSPGFLGITDTLMVQSCDFLKSFGKGMSVMVNRGFKNIEQCSLSGVQFVRPPSIDIDNKVKEIEALRIANLHEPMQSVMNSLREFSMLKPHRCLDKNMITVIDDIVLIACAFVNLGKKKSD